MSNRQKATYTIYVCILGQGKVDSQFIVIGFQTGIRNQHFLNFINESHQKFVKIDVKNKEFKHNES